MVRIGLPQRLKSSTGHSQPSSRASSPPRGNGQCLTLKVAVLRGRNLAAKDKSGTSDPYLMVALGDAKQSTTSISKNLNPEWMETLDFSITSSRGLLLEAVCWDKDRFSRKDYMGEFDVLVEDVLMHGKTSQEPQWHTLKSTRGDARKKGSQVSGEIQLQLSLVDPQNPAASEADIINKFRAITAATPTGDQDESPSLSRLTTNDTDADADPDAEGDGDDDEEEEEISDETDDPTKPEGAEKRRRRLRLAALKRKSKARAYELSGGSECTGMVFLEILRITDLPPERNVTRTSFDMDPFVVVSVGRKTFRTKVIRHNLNPVYDEKLVFQIMRHEQQYSMNFAVVDRDKLSGNDFVGTTNFPLSTFITDAPEPDPETGLYPFRDPPEPASMPSNRSRFKLSKNHRSSSGTSLNKLSRPGLQSRSSQASMQGSNGSTLEPVASHNGNSVASNGSTLTPEAASRPPTISSGSSHAVGQIEDVAQSEIATWDDPDMKQYTLPLNLKHKEKWSDRHPTQLYIKAKYLPYPALRQQFWRAMLRHYDADDSGRISKIELTTMLDTLGSTLKESTIDRFFHRWASDTNGSEEPSDLTFDQAIVSLEDQLQRSQSKSVGETVKGFLQSPEPIKNLIPSIGSLSTANGQEQPIEPTISNQPAHPDAVPELPSDSGATSGDPVEMLEKDELRDDRSEEHVIEIRECPICHQPRLNKRSDADIITHIATCASSDWRQVNNLVMAGFVTSSQAQRKWYSKVITKIGYGGYRLGANSANILVQDRITGQINEERMSVYVRLGIRLLYKGLKSREMEKRRIKNLLRSLSIKQGRKYDDPASVREIQGFIDFHQLDMNEVLLPQDQFKNFNQFFYRALKPDARPCSAPDNPKIIVSPADCRSVVFNKIDDATTIWVKGREFSLPRLLGKAYPEDAQRYVGGSLGIFRLAPQDYHRFHVPVDGVLNQPKLIEGEYYTVNPMAIRSALDVYGENVRVVCPIDSVAHGRVMFICIGAMMVGSTVITRKTGEQIKRAEELGYFKFGGSTVLLLFEPGVMRFDDDLQDNSSGALETLIRVGMSIGHSPEQAQHLPDMRKEEAKITEEERHEAMRRIEGSIAAAQS